MGNYTLFHLRTTLRRDTPPQVIAALRDMLYFEPGTPPPPLPAHPLFKTERWRVMLRMSSAYFDEPTQSDLFDQPDGSWRLEIQCNFKNYDGEITHFIEWISPYMSEPEGALVGYSRYEYDERNTPLFRRVQPKALS